MSTKAKGTQSEQAPSIEARGRNEKGPTHDRIAESAYLIWLAKDQPSGKDVDHWCEAEAQLQRGAVSGSQ